MRETRQLKFPLVVGQKRSEKFETNVRGTNRLESRNTEIETVGIDQITTPAGTYRAFKIYRNDWGYGKSLNKWIYFYSPETKSIIKYNYEALSGSSATWDVDLIKFLPVQ
jgi:hypothetical protein